MQGHTSRNWYREISALIVLILAIFTFRFYEAPATHSTHKRFSDISDNDYIELVTKVKEKKCKELDELLQTYKTKIGFDIESPVPPSPTGCGANQHWNLLGYAL